MLRSVAAGRPTESGQNRAARPRWTAPRQRGSLAPRSNANHAANDESRWTLAADGLKYATADDGVRLAYRVVGDAPTVVLVPAASWIGADLEPLAKQHTCVFYDVRGQGLSDAVSNDQIGFERDVADLGCLLDQLEGAPETVHLLGWSYYGAVAVRFAFASPERVARVVLAAPIAPRANPHWRTYLDNFGKRLDAAAFAALEAQRREGLRERDPAAWCRVHNELLLKVYVADPASLARMKSTPCVRPNLDPETVNQQMLRIMEGMGAYDWRNEMAGMQVPTLIVHGDDDPVPIEGSHEWVDTLADARLEILEGSGHLPWIEMPDRFFPPVESFLGGDDDA